MFIYARALRYFRPYLWPTLGGVVLTFVAIIVNSLKPWPFKYIVDGVLPSDATHGTEEARAFIKTLVRLCSAGTGRLLALPYSRDRDRARRPDHPRQQLSFHQGGSKRLAPPANGSLRVPAIATSQVPRLPPQLGLQFSCGIRFAEHSNDLQSRFCHHPELVRHVNLDLWDHGVDELAVGLDFAWRFFHL